jgi:hypothetical protein
MPLSPARPRGFTPTDAGTLGALMLAGGVLGAVVLPPFSDRQHKRQRYLLLGAALITRMKDPEYMGAGR